MFGFTKQIDDKQIKTTSEWQLYEKGRNYLRTRDFFDRINKCIRFYEGDQWHGANLGDVSHVQHNFLEPVVNYKTSNLDTYQYEIVFNANNYESPELEKEMIAVCKDLNSHVQVIWEQERIDKLIRKMKKRAAISGEGIIYFYFKPSTDNKNEDNEDIEDVVTGEFDAEIIETTDIFYGDENNEDIQKQPYILIKKRCNLDDVIDEARKNKISEEEISNIGGDKEFNEQTGDPSQYEVDDKVLVITKFYKKNGSVHCIKSTRGVTIQEEKDLSLKYYPIAHFLWKERIGSSRGRGEIENLIANQIEVNKTLVRRAMIIKMIAYPKPVVNIDKIKNPSAINKVGATIELSGAVDNINNYFGYIQPTQTSSEAVGLQNELISTSRELANASDVVTGSVNPEQASGKAILAIQQAAQQPLNDQLLSLKDTLEDIGYIILDIWRAYNVNGMNVMSRIENKNLKEVDTGENKYEVKTITPEILEKLKPYIKIDITPKSSYDKYAQEQSYENLLVKGLITFEEYVECLDETSSMNKRNLLKIIQKRQERQAEVQRMQNAVNEQKNKLQQELETEAMTNQVETDVPINEIQNRTAEAAQQIMGG